MAVPDATADDATRLCQGACKAKCCRYITVVLPPPKRKADFDEIGWFVAHEGVMVYVQSRRWHLEVETRCGYLTPDNLCAMYDDRPDVCREHDPEACEHSAPLECSLRFESKEEFDRWYQERRKAGERQRRRRTTAERG